jgi:D-serine deaminase-like pyridoxal phosphate-dependent protein
VTTGPRLYDSYRTVIAGRPLPLAWADLDRIDRNLDAMAERAAGRPIRIASKSLRCPEVILRVLEHPAYRGVLGFTPAEAAFLHERFGIDDIVVAYPNVEPVELEAAFDRIALGANITLMVDSVEHVERIGRLAFARSLDVPVCLDVDMSLSVVPLRAAFGSMAMDALPTALLHFGVRRSPVTEVEHARSVGQAIHRTRGVRLEGVMGYEAQIAGLPDRTGRWAFDRIVRQLKKRSVALVRARRKAIVDRLRSDGHAIRFVNGGGTGSLESTAGDPIVTEVSAGSGVYVPTSFDGFDAFQHEPAAGFVLPVVRRPTDSIVTCLGGGYVASGAAGPSRLPSPYLPPGLSLLEAEGAGEVQTPLQVPRGLALEIGDPVFFRHCKAGELCERFDALTLLADGRVVGDAKTYRGLGQTFL